MDQVTVRTADLQDLERLLDFEQKIIDSERPLDDTIRTGLDVHYYDLSELIASPDAEVVVAEVNSEIIGSGYAQIKAAESYLRHDKYSYLGFMYVVPDQRGKGVNKMIVEALEAWSLVRGVSEVRLEVYANNPAAIRAYEKSGYCSLLHTMRRSLTKD